MPLMIVAATAAALMFGLAAGWFLRKRNRWCPSCGGILVCRQCMPFATAAVRRGWLNAGRQTQGSPRRDWQGSSQW
jgi:hypothetical protein